jgi:hypothetical protein
VNSDGPVEEIAEGNQPGVLHLSLGDECRWTLIFFKKWKNFLVFLQTNFGGLVDPTDNEHVHVKHKK